jgi:hypothetical protein
MSTSTSYSPSVNIKRDRRKALPYIATPNSKDVAASIINALGGGQKAHVIVGAYGSGKSIFLWALAKTLAGNQNFFEVPSDTQKYHVVNIVGQFGSIRERFATEFNIESDKDDILDFVYDEYLFQKEEKKKEGLIILIDEFGKFLEYAARYNPEEEIYFLQELAELVNNPEVNILLVCTLHQNFSAYGYTLNKQQRNEWSKVQGRFHEVTFNEPVEQLLFLASQRLEQEMSRKPRGFGSLFDAIKRSRSFPLRDYMTQDIAQKLYPLDILSAGILTLALQRYGQNERSLFSFLESPDRLALTKERRSKYYSLSDVYDYLKHSFTILSTKHNPHYVQWASMASSLERIEGVFDHDLAEAQALVKTIGLLNTFGAGSMILDDAFLKVYGKQVLSIKDTKVVLTKLVDKRIIRYTNFNRRYVLFDGTDLDISLAIDEAGQLIEQVKNVIGPLRDYFSFQVIAAKAAYYQRGTPRFFEYVLSDTPTEQKPLADIDGFINLVFSEQITADELLEFAAREQRPIIYGLYENTSEIQRLIFEIRKIEKVIENNQEDRVAVRELKNILAHQKKLLNHYVLDNLASSGGSVRWIDFAGEHTINSERDFNRRLSEIIDTVYAETPTYSSELINRTRLSGAIKSAHRKFMTRMFTAADTSNWGYDDQKFPPERTIFLSLIKDKGFIKQTAEGSTVLGRPTDASFQYLWERSVTFIESSRSGARSLRAFIDELMRPPLKMKYGFLQFWLPVVLYIERNSFALYEGDAYIPALSPETLELVLKHPHKYTLKAFRVEGVDLQLFSRYRNFLDQKDTVPSNDSFIETIRPFLTFYRSLNTYAKRTSRLSTEAIQVRRAITKSKDPEVLFFRDLPAALGKTKQELVDSPAAADKYIADLQGAIREIRTSFELLVRRFLNYIKESTGYEDLRNAFVRRYENLQLSLLTKKQSAFYQRLTSDLDDVSFASSLAQTLLGRSLEKITDEEEPRLYRAFTSMLEELDNVTDISKKAGARDIKNFVLIDVQSIEGGRVRRVVRLSKSKRKKVEVKKAELYSQLGKDKSVSIAVFTEMLKELLHE